jgi:hypothetical protein
MEGTATPRTESALGLVMILLGFLCLVCSLSFRPGYDRGIRMLAPCGLARGRMKRTAVE